MRISGSGRPLLLMHGLGVSADGWAPLEKHLSGFEMISFDPPGIGASPPTWRATTMGGLARLVSRLLFQIDRPQVDLLGLSWGGLLAQQLAHDHPTQVRRLVLCGTGVGLGSMPGDPRAMTALLTTLRTPWIANLIYGTGATTNPAELRQFLKVRGRPSLIGYYGQIARLAGWSSLPWLRQLSAPTLVMAGTQDRLVPPINARILAGRLPNARLHWVDDGHLFLLLRAAECAAVIRRFLSARDY